MGIITIESKELGTVTFDDTQFRMNVTGTRLVYISNEIKPTQPIGLTNYSFMFAGRDNIETLDLSDWDMSEATNINSMFNGCRILKTINGIEKINLPKVIYFGSVFLNCRKFSISDMDLFLSTIPVDEFFKSLDAKSGITKNTNNVEDARVIHPSSDEATKLLRDGADKVLASSTTDEMLRNCDEVLENMKKMM